MSYFIWVLLVLSHETGGPFSCRENILLVSCHYFKDLFIEMCHDSFRRSSGCELEIQERKVPAAMYAIGKKKRNTQGIFVLCLNRTAAGRGVRVARMVLRGEWGKRG